jgi:hypothetical protein
MTPTRFTSAAQILEHCTLEGARLREVITDLHHDPPRVFLICGDRTFMLPPDELLELQHHHVFPPDIVDYLIERRLLPVTARRW